MDGLIAQVGQWFITQGWPGVFGLAAIGWGWLERSGRNEERKDRKDAQDKLEKAQERYSVDLQAQAEKLRELAEKWAALMERDKRSGR